MLSVIKPIVFPITKYSILAHSRKATWPLYAVSGGIELEASIKARIHFRV